VTRSPQRTPAATGYRADIDGLRALAVLPVVLFHARVPGFAGGYTGVDIFFVISGFLITGVLREELDATTGGSGALGTRSLARFYERRIRRILPAMLAMLGVCLLAALWIDLPGEMVAFSDTLAATASFSTNILLWLQTGYFDPSAHTRPLLHTWSLAVEEQFYIVFPLLLVVLTRWLRPHRARALLALAVGSFAFSVWGVAHMPTATFYLLPARGWELMIGALLALDAVPPIRSRAVGECCTALGLLAIAAGIVLLDAHTPFPGVNALYPTLGAALVIVGGTAPSVRLTELLGSRPLVAVGLVSYSLYLWHWPLLVFGAAVAPTMSTTTRLALVAAAAVIAWLSWRFVERPFRGPSAIGTRRDMFRLAAVASVLLVAIGLGGHRADGWPSRLPVRVRGIAAYAGRSEDPAFERCFAHPRHAVAPEEACRYGAAVAPSVVLWSDSHGAPVVPVLGEALAHEGAAVRFLGKAGCPPIVGLDISNPNRADCRLYTTAVRRYLDAHPELHTVVLMARFPNYVDGRDAESGPAEAGEPEMLVTDAGRAITDPLDRRTRYVRALDETVRMLRAQGRRVFIVYPVPEVGYDVPSTLARKVRLGGDPAQVRSPRARYEARQRWMAPALDSIVRATGADAVHPERWLCDASTCRLFADGAPLYTDAHHLSRPGALFILPAFADLIAVAGGR
jgi:peptidoglycan/LPS O-acetylase OafA/YrhL